MKRTHLIPLFSYFLLTVLMTWPTAAQFTGALPGDGFDGWQNYWNLWWVKEALLIQRTHPFFTSLLYPPAGVSLLFHTLNFFNGLWALPLQLLFGLTVAYNAVVLFHFTLSGYGVYLLARYVLARLGQRGRAAKWGAFAGGLVFTFSPFHMAHLLGHMQVFSLTWPPLYILAVVRVLDGWRLEDRLSWRGLAVGGLYLVMASAVDWYQTLYLLLFTALALVWTLWTARADRGLPPRSWVKPTLGLAAMGLLFGVLFSPLILPMVREALSADYMKPGFDENVTLSADLLAFFVPSELHPWWGPWAARLQDSFSGTTAERLVFAGFTPVLLAVLALLWQRRRRTVQFWLVYLGFFFVMALGPYLHVAGQIVRWGQIALPMPYFLLYKIVPFIGISRSLSRFDLMVMIGLGVLAAIGTSTLANRLMANVTNRNHPASRGKLSSSCGWLVPLSLCVLIGVEFLAIPYPTSPVDTPAFYFELARDPTDYTIANLPMNWDRPSPLLYQTTHRKRLLTAYTSRNNPLEAAGRTPVFQQWRYLSDDIIEADLSRVAPTVLHDFNVRYVVLDYYQMPPGPERDRTEKFVAEALPGVAPVLDDGRLAVYAAPAVDEPQSYLSLGEGWGPRALVRGRLVRSISGEASLLLHHPQGPGPVLAVEAFADRPQPVALLVGGVSVATLYIRDFATPQYVQLVSPGSDPAVITLRPSSPASPIFVNRLALVTEMSAGRVQ